MMVFLFCVMKIIVLHDESCIMSDERDSSTCCGFFSKGDATNRNPDSCKGTYVLLMIMNFFMLMLMILTMMIRLMMLVIVMMTKKTVMLNH